MDDVASRTPPAYRLDSASTTAPTCTRAACPVCGGRLIEIRAKLQCSHCRSIIETCCEGGRA